MLTWSWQAAITGYETTIYLYQCIYLLFAGESWPHTHTPRIAAVMGKPVDAPRACLARLAQRDPQGRLSLALTRPGSRLAVMGHSSFTREALGQAFTHSQGIHSSHLSTRPSPPAPTGPTWSPRHTGRAPRGTQSTAASQCSTLSPAPLVFTTCLPV